MVGIVAGQTARLNVVSAVPPDPTVVCEVELMFFDMDGMVLAETSVRLSPGMAAFHDLNGDEFAREGRLQVRAEVMIPDTRNCNINITSTLEVFDNATGKTEFVLTPPDPM